MGMFAFNSRRKVKKLVIVNVVERFVLMLDKHEAVLCKSLRTRF